MRQGPKPAKSKEAKLPVGPKSPKGDARVRDLEKRLAEALRDKAAAQEQLQTSHRERAEAQEQQAATAEILRVISSSPTDIQFVFDTIVRTAATLCDAFDANLVLVDGDEFVQRAHHGPITGPVQDARYPLRGTVSGRAISEARVIQVDDLAAATEYPLGSKLAQQIGYRTTLIVPLVRDGVALGVIGIRRTKVKPFADNQITLLKTFADQAVIAIENERLFKELQQKNQDLNQAHAQVSESLDQQTAMSEILRVIASSPTDVQPVFDVLIAHAHRLCDGVFANAVWFDGEMMHNMADHGFGLEAREVLHRAYPRRPTPESIAGRAILAGSVVQSEDLRIDNETTLAHRLTRLVGARAYVSVPMLRDGISIGAIIVARRERGLFPPRQVELLKTFADQAVIAIENVRLFKELEARNRDLTEALDRQTATAEILGVISQSQSDVQPVFEAIVDNAK